MQFRVKCCLRCILEMHLLTWCQEAQKPSHQLFATLVVCMCIANTIITVCNRLTNDAEYYPKTPIKWWDLCALLFARWCEGRSENVFDLNGKSISNRIWIAPKDETHTFNNTQNTHIVWCWLSMHFKKCKSNCLIWNLLFFSAQLNKNWVFCDLLCWAKEWYFLIFFRDYRRKIVIWKEQKN